MSSSRIKNVALVVLTASLLAFGCKKQVAAAPPPPPPPPPPPVAPAPPAAPAIRPDQVSTLQGNATWFKGNANVRFTIEGHCDERGSAEYNLGLGDRRANAAKEYLISQGVAANRVNTVSYGKERPVCRDPDEMCYQKNRRDAFTRNP